MERYDLIIIGAGPGGYEAAFDAAGRYGMRTAVIERSALGGTCLNRGCIPTKTLLHTAGLYRQVKTQNGAIGLRGTEGLGFDLGAMLERKDEVVAGLRKGIAAGLRRDKVDVFIGNAALVDANTVCVNSVRTPGPDACQSPEAPFELKGGRIMIATGSRPLVPPIAGADLHGVWTSSELLSEGRDFESLVIVGGGVIGLEFAGIYASLGIRVAILEGLDRLLATADRDISQSIRLQMKKDGVEVHTQAMLKEIRQSGGALTCVYDEKGALAELTADRVLMSVGRRPETEGLFAPEAVPELRAIVAEDGYIKVDERFETSVPGVYAIGDVIGGVQLAHMATAEGRACVAMMNGRAADIDLVNVPVCVYTTPEIAAVGLSQDGAKAAGLDVTVCKYPMGANGKSVLSMAERGMIKIIAETSSRRVLGAVLMCERATDMISDLARVVSRKLTLDEIGSIVYPHPSFSEAVGEAARLKQR